MRVVHQILSPGVQERDEADRGAKVPWIRGDRLQRFGGCLKQDVVDGALVLECNGRDLLRHGEHHVEVRDGQQVRLTVVEPFCSGERLALRAVPVATRVVGDALVSTGVALLDVTAQGCCAALLNGAHDTTLLTVERIGMQMPVCGAVTVQDVRQLQRGLHRGSDVVNWRLG
jgi:hypothetical protein